MKQKSNVRELKQSIYSRVNVIWVISILVVLLLASIVILILQDNIIKDGAAILKYVGPFATFLSIVLSVFAIQYTYFSNDKIDRQFEKINGATNLIHEASNQITKTSNHLDENISKILKTIERIDRAVNPEIQKPQNQQIDETIKRVNSLDNIPPESNVK